MQSEIVESSLAEACCACLTTTIRLTKTTDCDATNIDTLTKLRYCIPEVTWTKAYICGRCLDTLNQSYLFKELCIRTNESLFLKDCQQILVKKEEISESDQLIEEANDPEHDEDSKDDNESVCNRDYIYNSTDNNIEGQLQQESNEKGCTEKIFIKKEESNEPVVVEESTRKCKRNRSLICEICNEFTGAYKKLVSHVADIHKVDPKTISPYKCDQCGMRYKTSLELSHHKIRHPARVTRLPKTRKVKCEICSKWFLRNTHLNSHIQRKHVDRNLWEYACSFCDQKYPSKWDYERHLRHHTGEKPFGCHLCDQKFILKSILQNHLTTHSDVRNFKCDYCDRGYKLKSTLKKHLKKVHNVADAKVHKEINKIAL